MKSMNLWQTIFSALITAGILLSLGGLGSFAAPPSPVAAVADEIFHLAGSLAAGETEEASIYPLFGTEDKVVNLKIVVSSPSETGAVALDIEDGQSGAAFSGTALSGETLWTTFTLKPGDNTFTFTRSGTGTEPLDYEIWLYEVDTTPYTWAGVSKGTGTWRSHIQLDFPEDGLYTFDFGLTEGRYQFEVNEDFIKKTVEADGEVVYYVPAGTHALSLPPDSTEAQTTWELSVAKATASVDSLPYTKTGGELGGTGNDFTEEWLPIYLSGAAETNFELAVTGDGQDTFTVELYAGETETAFRTITGIQGGETLWWTDDLATGLSRIHMIANGNTASLAYDFTMHTKPNVTGTTPASWAGTSTGDGNNTSVRFSVDQAGLYDITYGVNPGRYQFAITSDAFIQKTVEQNGSVRYYLAAGDHELDIVQDPDEAETTWSVEVATTSQTYDTLPYTKAGGHLEGSSTIFDEVWLPLYVETAGEANFNMIVEGDLADGLYVVLQQGNPATAVYTTPIIYGQESFWWTTDLTDGVNQIQIVADGANAGALAYDLTVESLDLPPATWSGVASKEGGNSVARVNLASDGVYHVVLNTPVGSGQVLIDDGDTSMARMQHETAFDVSLSAGIHDFTVVQSTTAVTTTWTMSVTSTAAEEMIAQFSGNLADGETVDPQLPLLGTASKQVNFELSIPEVAGTGAMMLTITDGKGASVFTGEALDGETVWGTAVLQPGQNTFKLDASGVAMDYLLSVYEVAKTAHTWDGRSLIAGDWDSHITLNFPTSGLYDFDLGLASGRYQLLVNDMYIQKTAETTGTVRYYVPSGDHKVTIVPDRGSDTSWGMGVTASGVTADTLPYTKEGGDLDGSGGVFTEAWLPINLTAATETNMALTVGGADTDKINVAIYEGAATTPSQTITDVYGGETVWWTTDFPAGTSRFHLETDAGNTDVMTYTIEAHAQPQLPASWAGVSAEQGRNTQVEFTVPAAGLYDFSYDALSGRYQLLVSAPDGKDEIRKTVEAKGTLRAYLAAGVHKLTVIQDTAAAVGETAWDIGIQAANTTYDALPYTKTGGIIGGAQDFDRDLIPMHLEQDADLNFEMTLGGDPTSDLMAGLVVYLYNDIDGTPVFTTPVVYDGETFWWTTDLTAGVRWIELVAEDGNAHGISYDLTVYAVPTLSSQAPYSWGGVSKATGVNGGANANIMLQAPVSGDYHVIMDIPEGFASLGITPVGADYRAVNQRMANGTRLEFDVPLEQGAHIFTTKQSSSHETTTWAITVTLELAPAPTITTVAPDTITNEVTQIVTITGTNFQPGLTVSLETMEMTDVTFVDSGQVTFKVPAGMTTGIYDVTITNADTQSVTATDALTVKKPTYWVFLPFVTREP